MTPTEFLYAIKSRFPRAKLTVEQDAAFRNHVERFRLSEDLADQLAETCEKVFPSLADVARVATRARDEKRPWLAPHRWSATACRYCAGEGRVALFGVMLYGDQDEFRIETALPYSSEFAIEARRNGTSLVEMVARCKCESGDAVTLGSGMSKWDGTMKRYRSRVA